MRAEKQFVVPNGWNERSGLELAKSGIRVLDDGTISLPRWKPDKNHTVYTLSEAVYQSLPEAIRACSMHIPASYKVERELIASFLTQLEMVARWYVSCNVNVTNPSDEVQTALEYCAWHLRNVKLPIKKHARAQIVRVHMTGLTDALLRRNPGRAAAIVMSAVFDLHDRRLPDVAKILCQVAVWKVILQQTRRNNFVILKEFDRRLADFISSCRTTSNQFDRRVSAADLESMIVYPNRLVLGRPYCQIVSCINSRVITIIQNFDEGDSESAIRKVKSLRQECKEISPALKRTRALLNTLITNFRISANYIPTMISESFGKWGDSFQELPTILLAPCLDQLAQMVKTGENKVETLEAIYRRLTW